MTAEALTLVAAIAIPIVALAALIGVIRSLRELEHSRDDLIERGLRRSHS